MNIKEEIVKFLEFHTCSNLLPLIPVECHDIEEMTNFDFIALCVHFINAKFYENNNLKTKSISEYENFLFYVEEIFCSNKKTNRNFNRLFEIYKNILKNSVLTRSDKIYFHNYKKSFKFDFIDWEDQDWLFSLIFYFCIISIENIQFLKLEVTFEEIKLKNTLVVNKKDRKDLLVKRIQPKYTLDQFADKLMKNIAKRTQNDKLEEVEIEEIEKELAELRQQDELNDDRHISKGNTDNVG